MNHMSWMRKCYFYRVNRGSFFNKSIFKDTYFFLLKKWQICVMPHRWHLGLRAKHVYLPWSNNQWCAFGIKFWGMCFTNCFSLSNGFLAFVVRPIRSETLKMCVSTAIVGWFHHTAKKTFAVFLPTPANVCNSSRVFGISPPYTSITRLAMDTRCVALLFG